MQAHKEYFRKAMRRHAGGVAIITTSNGGNHVGLTATAVCSLSMDPPKILACINLKGTTFHFLSESRVMTVNLLGRSQELLAREFGGMCAQSGEPFLNNDWETTPIGTHFLKGAVASIDCNVDEMFITRSHAVVFGDVVNVRIGPSDNQLMYFDGQFAPAKKELPEPIEHRFENKA